MNLVGFLIERLTEDLALIWARDRARDDTVRHPGMPAQVAVIDDLLTTLRQGELPERRELRILLMGYGTHPGYDPRWTENLQLTV